MDKTRGYVVLAQNTTDVDYIELAYALAMSIKLTQSSVNKVCLITDQEVEFKHIEAFDDIVRINEDDTDPDSDWRINNKWMYYDLSPYDQSMILDVDMIFCSDVSHWWDACAGYDMVPTMNVRTYRDDKVISTFYRNAFRLNKLQNVYTGAYYFEKCDSSEQFFKLVKELFRNWKSVYQTVLPLHTPPNVSADVIYAIAWDIMGRVAPDIGLSFVHMKFAVQGWQNVNPNTDVDWTEVIMHYSSDDGRIVIGNWLQTGIFHYVQKDYIHQNDYMNRLEERYGVFLLQSK